ncbi:MAG: hypothetical protein GY870_00290 [archaeon]|nr:hypothetical protein [archaeon]
MDNGYEALFDFLCDRNEDVRDYVEGVDLYEDIWRSRPLFLTSGEFNQDSFVSDPWGNWGWTASSEITPLDFVWALWMQGLSGNRPAGDDLDETTNPYIKIENSDGSGLNDAGTKIVGQLVRQTIDFSGTPFIQTGGDPISLFNFLDQYYYTTLNGRDYSSYMALDYFDVKDLDFVDLLTGYSWLYNDFDHNGNGRVDDWRAPIRYANYDTDYWAELEDGNCTYELDSNGYDVNQGDPNSNQIAVWDGWGDNFWHERLFWHESLDNFSYNGGVMWTDSPGLLDYSGSSAFDLQRTASLSAGNVHYDSGIGFTSNMSNGAPPCVDLIDMFVWLSNVLGEDAPFNSTSFFQWIIGELDPSYYDIISPDDGTGNSVAVNFEHGIGLSRTWDMLTNATFNVTGLFNWLEKKNSNPFKLMWELDNFNNAEGGTPDPSDLMYFTLNPNAVISPDGHQQFIYHDALGSTSAESQQLLWNLYNSSYWHDKSGNSGDWNDNFDETTPYKLIEYFRSHENMSEPSYSNPEENQFNFFYILEALDIDPASWYEAIRYLREQDITTIAPLSVIFADDKLNLVKLISNSAVNGGSSNIKINGTMNLGLCNSSLSSDSIENMISYSVNPTLFTAEYHWSEFITPEDLYTAGNFVVLN